MIEYGDLSWLSGNLKMVFIDYSLLVLNFLFCVDCDAYASEKEIRKMEV